MKAVRVTLLFLCIGAIAIAGYSVFFPNNLPTVLGPYDEGQQAPRAATSWDWLDLLVVPIVLLLAAWVLSNAEKNAERETQIDQHRQETLQTYFDRLSELLLKNELRKANSDHETRNLARHWSLAALRKLDGNRKAEVIQFLYEANLIDKDPTIDLNGANIRAAGMETIVLTRAQIRGAYFDGADLRGANLRHADFCGSSFRKVDFRNAILDRTDLSFTLLIKANLSNIDLSTANLKGADLSGANIWGSIITDEQRKLIVLSQAQDFMLDMIAFFKRARMKKAIIKKERR